MHHSHWNSTQCPKQNEIVKNVTPENQCEFFFRHAIKSVTQSKSHRNLLSAWINFFLNWLPVRIFTNFFFLLFIDGIFDSICASFVLTSKLIITHLVTFFSASLHLFVLFFYCVCFSLAFPSNHTYALVNFFFCCVQQFIPAEDRLFVIPSRINATFGTLYANKWASYTI